MAKRKRVSTIKIIERRIKEGRGKGHFVDYKPWLTVHDVASLGIVTRVLGWKSERIHHFLSEHYELAHFYQMEWSNSVIDIREQYPLLPLEKTLYISEKLGIKHPTDPTTQQPIVMTTDMLLTHISGNDVEYWAHSIKPSSKLSKRVLEKLEIERRYFEDTGIKWSLISEKQINYDLVKNVAWIHSYRTLEWVPNINQDLVEFIEPYLFEALQDQSKSCAKTALEVDIRFTLPPGTSMNILKYFIANRFWVVDMTCLIQPHIQPLMISRGMESEVISNGDLSK